MTQLFQTLDIRSSPHISGATSVDTIMFNVVLALLPAAIFAVYAFGLAALLTLTTAVISCVLTEVILCRVATTSSTAGDWSVTVTGLLYGLTLPPALPLWMVAAGGMVAVGLGKFLFGGLGYNPFNPALVGRAVLQASFPAAMTSWPAMPSNRICSVPSSTLAWPLTQPVCDAISGATPLASWKFDQELTNTGDLLLGSVSGSTGETCALLILVGGVYLVARRMMSWRIPVAILLTVTLFSSALHLIDPTRYAGPLFMLFSGGLMLGAVFMATDMVASPMTHAGCVLYGVLIGALVIVIRVWGGLPEGVMYAILLGNAVSPHIDNWIQPRVYGCDAEVLAMSESTPAFAATADAGKPRIWPMYRALICVGVACALIIVIVFEVTEPVIRSNKLHFRSNAVLEVLPRAKKSAAFRLQDDGSFELTSIGSEEANLVFAGYDEDNGLVGLAFEAQGMGYQDAIRLLYGYSFDSQAIIGFRVLESLETPGLGDRIETDEQFLRNFNRLDVRVTDSGDKLVHPLEFVKPGQKNADWQVDGITGATISSSATARMLGESARHWIPRVWECKADFLFTPIEQSNGN